VRELSARLDALYNLLALKDQIIEQLLQERRTAAGACSATSGQPCACRHHMLS